MDSNAFKAACLDHPGDPAPRLAYADWLDESGDPRGDWLRWSADGLPKLAERATAGKDATGKDMGHWLDGLQRRRQGDRLLRLAACACVRWTPCEKSGVVWNLLTDPRSRKSVLTAELFACGLATQDELAAARAAARAAAWAAARDACTRIVRSVCLCRVKLPNPGADPVGV